MNIDEIKRKLNMGRLPNQPGVNCISNSSVPESENRKTKPLPKEQDRVVVNCVFDESSSDEEVEPNSKVWQEPNLMIFPLEVPPSRFIQEADLNNPEDDWRVQTRRGRSSRSNFTKYLMSVL